MSGFSNGHCSLYDDYACYVSSYASYFDGFNFCCAQQMSKLCHIGRSSHQAWLSHLLIQGPSADHSYQLHYSIAQHMRLAFTADSIIDTTKLQMHRGGNPWIITIKLPTVTCWVASGVNSLTHLLINVHCSLNYRYHTVSQPNYYGKYARVRNDLTMLQRLV